MDLIKLLDNLITEKDQGKRGSKEITSHYPSSASIKTPDGVVIGSCLLAKYRQWTKVPETNPWNANAIQKMAWGNLVQGFVENLLKDEILTGRGLVKGIQTEVPVKSNFAPLNYPVSGKIDILLDNVLPIEIKSSFGQFFFSKKTGILSCGPKPEHLMQILCYLILGKFEKGILLYLARDTGFKVSYEIRVKEGFPTVTDFKGNVVEHKNLRFDSIVSRWKDLEFCLERKIEPEPDFKFKSKYPCNYCTYYGLCYEKPKSEPLAKFDQGNT